MAAFSWNDYPEERTAAAQAKPTGGSAKGFDWSQYPVEGESLEESSPQFDAKAALQGFGQFATSGYLPELTGAAGKMVPDPTAGLDAQLKAQGFKISQPDFKGVTTDESRTMQKQMAKDSPGSYYTGGAVGAIASAPAYGAALKGLGIAKAVPAMGELAADAPLLTKAGAYAANLGARMGQAAKEGAVLGFAANPNTEVGDQGVNLGRRVVNSGISAGVSAAIPVAGDAIKGAWNGVKSGSQWAGTKLLSSLGGVKPDVIQEYAQYADRISAAPNEAALKQVSDDLVGKLSADVDAKKINAEQAQEALKGLQSDLRDAQRSATYDARDAVTSAQQTLKDAHGSRLQQLSGDIYDSVNQLKKDVQAGSGDALKTLDKSDAMIDLAPTKDAIDSTIAKLKKSGTDEALSIAGKLDVYKERLATNYGEAIPAADAKKLIQGLDQVTTYSPMAGSFDQAKNAAFKGVRGSLDQTLKETVPEYAEKMQSVAADTDLLNRVSDFGDKQTGVGLLGRIEAPNQLERKAALTELGQKYNTDFVAGAHPKNLPEQKILQQAQAAQESLRPDRVASKMEQTLGSSRQQSALSDAQSALKESQEKLAPFKSLAPNGAGQTQAQQKLAQLGKGKNIELTDMFTQLGKLSNTDFVQAMKDQNTLSMFQKGAYNGSRNTLMGSLVGFLFGGIPGAAGGGAAGRVVDQWGPAMTKHVLDGAIAVSKTPTVQAIRNLSLPEPVKQQMITGLQSYLAQNRPFQGRGEDRWAQQGSEKLGLDPNLTGKIMRDPRGKQLLIQASDLQPGSNAMKNIQTQIQKGWGSP